MRLDEDAVGFSSDADAVRNSLEFVSVYIFYFCLLLTVVRSAVQQ